MPFDPTEPFEILETTETDPMSIEVLETSETMEPEKPGAVTDFLKPLSSFNQKAKELQQPLADFFQSLRIPIVSSVGEQLGALGAAGIETAVEALGGEGVLPGEQTFMESKQKFLEQQKEQKRAIQERSPIAAGLGEMAGAMALPTPFGASGGIAGAAKRILSEGAISLADELAMGEAEKALPQAGISSGVQTLVEATPPVLKFAGKVIKPIAKAYEKSAQRAGTIMTGGSIDELKEFMAATPKQRDIASKQTIRDFEEKATDLKDQIAKAADRPNEEFKQIYSKLNKEFAESVQAKDLTAIRRAQRFVDPEKKTALENIFDQNKELYKPFTKNVFGSIKKIINTGGPESGLPVKFSVLQKRAEKLRNMSEIKSPKDMQNSVKALVEIKQRIVRAKRQANEIKQSQDWDKLLRIDQRFLTELGSEIDKSIGAFSKGKEIIDVDKVYSKYMENVEKTFKPITTKGEIDESKFVNLIKGNSTRQRIVRRNLDKFDKFLKDTPKLQSDFGEIISEINKFKKEKRIFELLHKLKTAQGGPSSQSVKSSIGLAMAYFDPRTLLLMPGYNPLAYVRFRDFVETQLPKGRAVLNKLEKFYANGGRERLQRFIAETEGFGSMEK